MSEVLDYTLQSSQGGKYRVETDEENIEIILHPVIVKIFNKEGKYSFIVQNVISTFSDKPRFGPMCIGNSANSRPAKIRRTQILQEPKLVVKIENKTFEILINVTNISIYPEHRDPFGSPCVIISTVTLY